MDGAHGIAPRPDEMVSMWDGLNDTADDPEEIKVIFQALDSFANYGKVQHLNCTHFRRQALYALPQAHWQMLAGPPFNYLETLDLVDDAVDANAELARTILRSGLVSFGGMAGMDVGNQEQLRMPEEWAGIAKSSDQEKARSTIRQFYRDWSAEGADERNACNGPVFRALEAEAKRDPARADKLKVLVPGAGLGRLVFDLCRQGYHSEGNEISYHQLLASSYVLNSVKTAGQHTIYPWIHSFSNHANRKNQFKSYAVPDVQPQEALARAESPGSMEMCAADFLCLYGKESYANKYDAVAAVFFLDTAPNLIRYLEVIRHCLKPGGVLIHVGPLLWHWENNVPTHQGYDGEGDDGGSESLGIAEPGSFELTADEVVALVEKLGFVVEKQESGIAAPYVQDPDSMLQTGYRAYHWVARKTETPA